jgi:three-Cys-motif partner protein
MSADNSFFDESTDQSKVKIQIVSKYFVAWANVMMGWQSKLSSTKPGKIAYIDLFSGPGKYEDGTESTPLLVLKMAINNSKIRERLVTIFNDMDKNNIDSLKHAVFHLPDIDKLKYEPIFYSQEVNDAFSELFKKVKLIPSLVFIDPWGYKGVTLDLIYSVSKDWGCDCIFFFNYKRINMGLNNIIFKDRMSALFGENVAESLSKEINCLQSDQREDCVIEKLCQSIKKRGLNYVLPFRFTDSNGKRTSHHLIFISKNFKGYDIMKEIMAKMGSGDEQGVPSFEYNPIEAKYAKMQPLLFQLSRPLDDLKDMLLKYFAGRTLKMIEIYNEHNIDRPYIKKNYKDVLKELEKEEKISASPHKKGTFGDDVEVKFFPIKGGIN